MTGGHYLDTGAGPRSLDPVTPEPPTVTDLRDAYLGHLRECPTCLAGYQCVDAARLRRAYQETGQAPWTGHRDRPPESPHRPVPAPDDRPAGPPSTATTGRPCARCQQPLLRGQAQEVHVDQATGASLLYVHRGGCADTNRRH
ncbi:hypothetical protein [Actinacidiphila sp. ITFR-21]|uniref:hypothetical protein n=1 Tax=Actinacidiphila sp. ITFR-21 TaxID=3075199 RepID=UPI00288A4012|nr:hypothetical protein [Streptomyces sp. ITFR-21]WNI19245.1 hypothetical protein RLT57_29320 [Streptomyces sp. ITFR-21]